MITKFKIFENKQEPQIGDYVLCEYKDPIPDRILNKKGAVEDINNFLSNHIGIIENARENDADKYPNVRHYLVSYEKKSITYMLKTYGYFEYTTHSIDVYAHFKRSEIIYWSKNKEDLEAIINANKYNL